MPDFAELAEQVFPGPLSTNKWGDHYYGLPLDTNTRIIFANDAVLEAAGVTEMPATIEEFEAAMATVQETLGEGVYGYAEGGTGAWSVLPWIWTMGGAVTDEGLTTASGYLNGEGTVAAVTMLKDWLDKGWMSPSILGGGTTTSEQFGNDQTATILEGPWMPGIFNNQFPELTFSFTPVPAGPAGSQSVVGGEDIVVFNTTENKEAALAFVRHMLSEETQLAMGKVGQMPVLSRLVGHRRPARHLSHLHAAARDGQRPHARARVAQDRRGHRQRRAEGAAWRHGDPGCDGRGRRHRRRTPGLLAPPPHDTLTIDMGMSRRSVMTLGRRP